LKYWILLCGVLHKKAGHSKCRVLIAGCGIQNTDNSMEPYLLQAGKGHGVERGAMNLKLKAQA
jgi:hypothetical protein